MALGDEDVFLGRGDSFGSRRTGRASAPTEDVVGGRRGGLDRGRWRLDSKGSGVVWVVFAVRLADSATGQLLLLKMN